MSTRAMIGTLNEDNTAATGWYVHYDGYPTHLGRVLAALTHRDGVEKTLDALAVGVSWDHLDPDFPDISAVRANHKAPRDSAAYTASLFRGKYAIFKRSRPVVGYGVRHAEGAPDSWAVTPGTLRPATEADHLPCWIEWVYLFSADGRTLHVLESGDTLRASLPVDSLPEMTREEWAKIECGEQFERCSHYAWAHFEDVPEQSQCLGTSKWLGHEPVTHGDAIAVIHNGTRYDLDGSGFNGDFARAHKAGVGRRLVHTTGRFQPKGWYSSTECGAHVLTALGDGSPVPGLTYVFPPVKADVEAGRPETEVALAA